MPRYTEDYKAYLREKATLVLPPSEYSLEEAVARHLNAGGVFYSDLQLAEIVYGITWPGDSCSCSPRYPQRHNRPDPHDAHIERYRTYWSMVNDILALQLGRARGYYPPPTECYVAEDSPLPGFVRPGLWVPPQNVPD